MGADEPVEDALRRRRGSRVDSTSVGWNSRPTQKWSRRRSEVSRRNVAGRSPRTWRATGSSPPPALTDDLVRRQHRVERRGQPGRRLKRARGLQRRVEVRGSRASARRSRRRSMGRGRPGSCASRRRRRASTPSPPLSSHRPRDAVERRPAGCAGSTRARIASRSRSDARMPPRARMSLEPLRDQRVASAATKAGSSLSAAGGSKASEHLGLAVDAVDVETKSTKRRPTQKPSVTTRYTGQAPRAPGSPGCRPSGTAALAVDGCGGPSGKIRSPWSLLGRGLRASPRAAPCGVALRVDDRAVEQPDAGADERDVPAGVAPARHEGRHVRVRPSASTVRMSSSDWWFIRISTGSAGGDRPAPLEARAARARTGPGCPRP